MDACEKHSPFEGNFEGTFCCANCCHVTDKKGEK